MNDDPERETTTTYTYDPSHPTDVTRPADDVALFTRLAAQLERTAPPSFEFRHDPDQGVFRLTWPDGRTEVFRDKPVRHLRVEPDESGAMRPVLEHGRPVYLYLAREEREAR